MSRSPPGSPERRSRAQARSCEARRERLVLSEDRQGAWRAQPSQRPCPAQRAESGRRADRTAPPETHGLRSARRRSGKQGSRHAGSWFRVGGTERTLHRPEARLALATGSADSLCGASLGALISDMPMTVSGDRRLVASVSRRRYPSAMIEAGYSGRWKVTADRWPTFRLRRRRTVWPRPRSRRTPPLRASRTAPSSSASR